MADLVKIKKDGTETGATAADKINLSFTKVDTTTDNLETLYNRVDGIQQSTPAGKLSIAKPMQLEGAAQVPPATPNNDFATFVAVHTLFTQYDTKVLSSKGIITDVIAIDKTGIYYGGSIDATHTTVDVANSPVQGPIMVMASKDGHGNFGYFLMGMDEILHTGGRQAGTSVIKWNKIFDASDLGDLHTYVAGSTLVDKMMEMKNQLDKVSHSTSNSHAVVWAGSIPVDGAAGGFVMGYPDLFVPNPANPGQDIKDGTEHYVKFTEKDHPSTSTAWIWITDSGATKRIWTNSAKTTAVDGLSMGVYISKGAYVKIVVTAGEWFVKDVIIPALPQGTTKALLNDGSIRLSAGYTPNADRDIATVYYVKSFHSYDFVKLASELTVAGTAWEDAMTLTTPSRPAGVYELKWEILFTMNVVNKSAKFRYSIDDGATWAVLTREIKDKTNENTINLWFPYTITAAQVFKLKVQVAKEDAASVMKCKFGSIVVQRVK